MGIMRFNEASLDLANVKVLSSGREERHFRALGNRSLVFALCLPLSFSHPIDVIVVFVDPARIIRAQHARAFYSFFFKRSPEPGAAL